MRCLVAGEVTLEPQVAAHAEEMFAVLSDPAIYTHENQPPPSLEWLRERFRRLETRRSADGRERWLNWVIRMPSAELAVCPGDRARERQRCDCLRAGERALGPRACAAGGAGYDP